MKEAECEHLLKVVQMINDRHLRLVGNREMLGKPAHEALPELSSQSFFKFIANVYKYSLCARSQGWSRSSGLR